MPEGDTLHRAAARLRPALAGRELVAFEAPRLRGDRPTPGLLIEEVRAVGKHLLVDFDSGLTLRTHLGMPGSWRLVAAGERWPKPRHLMRALVVVEGWEAVCFQAPQVETYRRDRPGGPLGTSRDPLAHLGPDLCVPEPDLDAALARWDAIVEPGTTVAEVLLDQRVAAGIGNVYKSEVLHRLRVDPFVDAALVPVEIRSQLLETASRLLVFNLTTTRRTTISGPPGSTAVYGRARRPCPVCQTPVVMRRHGDLNRSTYWCPRCQPPGAVGRAPA